MAPLTPFRAVTVQRTFRHMYGRDAPDGHKWHQHLLERADSSDKEQAVAAQETSDEVCSASKPRTWNSSSFNSS
jgi:hypothetical protein